MGAVSLVNVAADAARPVAAPVRTADQPRVGRTGQGTGSRTTRGPPPASG